MSTKTIVGNALFAALYIAVSALIQPFGFTNIQFRISEMFNHLVVFNKKFIYGIILGVFLTNLFFLHYLPMISFLVSGNLYWPYQLRFFRHALSKALLPVW